MKTVDLLLAELEVALDGAKADVQDWWRWHGRLRQLTDRMHARWADCRPPPKLPRKRPVDVSRLMAGATYAPGGKLRVTKGAGKQLEDEQGKDRGTVQDEASPYRG